MHYMMNKHNAKHVYQKDTNKELMPVALHPTRRWDWCMSQNENKEIDPTFTDKAGKCQKLVEEVNMLLGHFGTYEDLV